MKRKKTLPLICALVAAAATVCLLSANASALYLSPGLSAPPTGEVIAITQDYLGLYGSFTSRALPLVPIGTPADSVTALLPDSVDGVLNNSSDTVPCDVIWSVPTPENQTPGLHDLTGTVTPPPGCTISAEAATVTFPIFWQQAGMEPLITPDRFYLFNKQLDTYLAELLTPDMDIQQLTFSTLSAKVVLANNQYITCPVKWDFSALTPGTPGSYTVFGTPVLPEGFALPAGFVPFSALVFVGDPENFTLAYVTQKNRSVVVSSWLYPITEEQLKTARLQYTFDPETDQWTDDPFVKFFPSQSNVKAVLSTKHALCQCNQLQINAANLTVGKPYYFRLQMGERCSDLLKITVEPDDSMTVVGGIGGDKDGGDRVDQPLPPVQQPVENTTGISGQTTHDAQHTQTIKQTKETKTTSQTKQTKQTTGAIQNETVTDTQTVLSGARLLQLLAIHPKRVPFVKQGVRVEFDTSFLAGLSIKAGDLVAVTIQTDQANGFSIDMAINQKKITNIPGTRIFITDSGKFQNLNTACLRLTHLKSGKQITAVYHAEEHQLVAELTQTGAYQFESAVAAAPDHTTQNTAVAAPASSPVTSPHTSAAPANTIWQIVGASALVALLIGGGVVVLLLFRRKQRHEKA